MRPLFRASMCLVWLGSLACGDPFEPILQPLPDEPETATLSDFRRAPLQEPAAFDVLTASEVRTDQFSGWDFVFEIDETGTPMLKPRGAVIGEPSDAGLLRIEGSFDGVIEAPEEGYETDEAVVVGEGDVLVAVSRRDPSFGTIRCRRFAKLEILDVDLDALTLEFRFLANPNCENHSLVPGALQ